MKACFKNFFIGCLALLNQSIYGDVDNSLELPDFNDVIRKNGVEENGLSGVGDQIVVRFEDDKKIPKISTSDQVSVDFVNEDIKSVLRYISELYDLNIIIPTTLSGNITLRLKNVDWRVLLDGVLTPLGCSYVEKDGVVQVNSEDFSKREPLQTKTFLLKFADAKAVANELQGFLDSESREKLIYNARANLLIWTGRGKNLSKIEEVIGKLDKPETQVMIEAKFVEATTNGVEEKGFKWPSALTFALDEKTTNNEGDKNASSNSDDTHGQMTYGLFNNKAFGRSGLFVQTLQASFNFSQTDTFGKTLSNPTIITMNNVPATMSVVSSYPVPQYSYNSDRGAYEINGFDEKPIGIELKVTPQVKAEYITLNLEPSLSTQTGTATFTAGSGTSVNYPQISKKQTNSTITIKSGYTIAIGGLMSQTKKDIFTKTPLLSNIPLLGNLFSNKEKKDEISNLLIFLSATQIAYDGTVVYPIQGGAKNVSDKKIFEMGLSDKDLPGEVPMTDKEKEMYAELRNLQNKLDSVLAQKKLSDRKEKLNSSLQNITKKGKTPPSKVPGRTAKLRKQRRAI